MKKQLLILAAVFAGLGALGFLVAASGVMPIKASSGHWAITRWFLEFSMSRSVSFHSSGITAPPLDDPTLILKGAGHFETGCFPCHGGPGMPQPRVPQAMTPHPPNLSEAAPEWTAEELFYIARHGVKFTGMPAFPHYEREDEVWAVTAFLLELPEMDVEQYRRLVHPYSVDQPAAPLTGLAEGESPPPEVVEKCIRCHGDQGQGRGEGAFPALAAQPAAYLQAALKAYSSGERRSGIMAPIAAGLTEDEMQAVADYYSKLQATQHPDVGAEEAIERGESIALEGVVDDRIPACSGCHGPAENKKNPHYPSLAGLHPSYVVLQLQIFQSNTRGGSEYAHLMQPVADRLSEGQMRDVALYYGALDSQTRAAKVIDAQ